MGYYGNIQFKLFVKLWVRIQNLKGAKKEVNFTPRLMVDLAANPFL